MLTWLIHRSGESLLRIPVGSDQKGIFLKEEIVLLSGWSPYEHLGNLATRLPVAWAELDCHPQLEHQIAGHINPSPSKTFLDLPLSLKEGGLRCRISGKFCWRESWALSWSDGNHLNGGFDRSAVAIREWWILFFSRDCCVWPIITAWSFGSFTITKFGKTILK